MEYEKDANFSNFTFDEDITPASTAAFLAHEVIFTIFTIIGMCADAAIIYVLLRFQRLRKTEYLFLANWAMADFGALLVAPSGYRVISLMDNLSISPQFMCSLFHLGQAFQVTAMLFVLLISIDWFFATYFQKTSVNFRKYYKYHLGAIWIFSILLSAITTGYCISSVYSVACIFLYISVFFIDLFVTVVLQSSRAVRKFCLKKPIENSSFLLNLTTAFVITYILGFMSLVLFDIVARHPLIGMIAEIIMFCSSIVNLIMLYNLDKDFQACFVQALRRGEKYEESACSFDNPLVNKVYDNCSVPIQISFKDNADLINNECY